MEYRVIRSEDRSDAAIEHALFGGRQKGAQNKNHKYIARAWLEGKWRYAYTQAELKILQNWGKNRGSLAGKQKENQLKREAKAAQKQVTKAEKDAKKVAQDTKKAASNAVTKAKGTANVLAGNARKAADTVSNKAGKAVYDTKKAAKELGEDLRSGVTAKQAKIKAETALNDAKNLPKWAKEDATKAANKVKEAASSAEAKGKQLLDKVTSKAKTTAKNVSDKAKETAKNVSDKAKDAKNYAATVDEKKRKAENDMTQATQDIYNARKQKSEALSKSDEAALNGNKKEAIDQQNKADAASRDERGAKAGFDSAKKQREEATKEQNSLRYKMSDLLSNGSKSKTAQAGKDKADKLINDAKSATKEAADKGKSVAAKLAVGASKAKDNAEEKLDSAKNKVEQTVNKARNKALDAVDQAKTNAEERSLHREAEKEYNKEMARRKISESKDKAEEAIDSVKNKVEQTVNKVRNKALDAADEAKIKAETKALEKEADKAYKEEIAKRESAKESSTSKAEAKGKELLDKIRNKANEIKNKITDSVNKAKEDSKEEELNTAPAKEKAGVNQKREDREEAGVNEKREELQTRLSNEEKGSPKNKNQSYENVEKMGVDIVRGKYTHVGHDEQVRRMVEDGHKKEDAELYATYAEARHRLHRALTEDEYKEFLDDYNQKHGGAVAKSKKDRTMARATVDDATEQKLYSDNPTYRKVSDQASSLGSYIDNMDANGGPKTPEARAKYNRAKRDLKTLENRIDSMRRNASIKNR